MSKNNRLPKKQVRDVKGQTQTEQRRIDIVPGNIASLTVQFLNSINQNLIEIKEALKNGRP